MQPLPLRTRQLLESLSTQFLLQITRTPDRKTFAKELDKSYAEMEKELKTTFEAQEYVSITADIWTANNKSFVGVTVHWIDAETLDRKKAAIDCRSKGRHTYDAIATELEDIFSQYGLTHDKVTACVTDNGSNFVKAFSLNKWSQRRRRRFRAMVT